MTAQDTQNNRLDNKPVCRYEDEWLLVLEKPARWVMYEERATPPKNRPSVAAFLQSHCGENLSSRGGDHRRGIVHRLDQDTSGLVVAAKNNVAHDDLQRQWQKRTIERSYIGFLYGALGERCGDMTQPIGRHPNDALKRSVQEQGKEAHTLYEVQQIYGTDFPLASKVRFQLKTGRTHQIRVHCCHHQCPVVGDGVYGRHHEARRLFDALWRRIRANGNDFSPYESLPATPITRQALHAARLEFRHPADGRAMCYEMEMPEDMQFLQWALEYVSQEKTHG